MPKFNEDLVQRAVPLVVKRLARLPNVGNIPPAGPYKALGYSFRKQPTVGREEISGAPLPPRPKPAFPAVPAGRWPLNVE